jgi:hypothetical protein
MKTVAILYGLLGGPRSGKALVRALEAGGYRIVDDANGADIIIAHSAGSFWLPPANPSQKYLLIGPPYWPDKSAVIRLAIRAKRNLRPRHAGYTLWSWVIRNAWGAYYAVFDLRRNLRILRCGLTFDLATAVQGRSILLVRNQDDSWITPDLSALRDQNPNLQIIELPGEHSDIAHHPERYVALLKSL